MFQKVFCRFSSTAVQKEIVPIVTNRNPRNLERMRIARKPVGYYYDKKNVEFWHKLKIEQSSRYVRASIVHNSQHTVLSCSTNEWALRKFLYSATDTSAYINLAKVFAERCLETGITSCHCDIDAVEGSKLELFLKTLEREGVELKEPAVYNPNHIWHKVPEKKPWLVDEDQ